MQFLSFGQVTHIGHVRTHNEDYYLLDGDLGLAIIADGMGGHDAGEVASRIVVDIIAQQVRSGADLRRATATANLAVADAAVRGMGRPDMGATVVAALLKDGQYEITWVGDSRAYAWADGRLEAMTRDHSVIQGMLDRGSITPDQAQSHPRRHLVTQAMGKVGTADLEVGYVVGRLQPQQRFLLCSDGLCAYVEQARIAAILAEHRDDQIATDRLLQAALDTGGNDNITILLFTVA